MKTIVLLFASVLSVYAQPLTLWYDQPARKWTEALPLGNGRLGAMIFGDPTNDHFQLNENTVWSGQRHYNPKPEMRENLPVVRKLLFEGKYVEAQALAEKTMTTPKDLRYGAYQPLGDVFLKFDAFDAPVAGYGKQPAAPITPKAYAEFYLDFLVADPRTGLLVSGPGTSPENQFLTLDRAGN